MDPNSCPKSGPEKPNCGTPKLREPIDDEGFHIVPSPRFIRSFQFTSGDHATKVISVSAPKSAGLEELPAEKRSPLQSVRLPGLVNGKRLAN